MSSGLPGNDPIAQQNGYVSMTWLLFFEGLYNAGQSAQEGNSEALNQVKQIAESAKGMAQSAIDTNTAQGQQIADLIERINSLEANTASKDDLQSVDTIANNALELASQLQTTVQQLNTTVQAELAKNYTQQLAQLNNTVNLINQVITNLNNDLQQFKADTQDNLDLKLNISDYTAPPADTDELTEGATNLYFSEARVLASLLTGLPAGTNTPIAETDSVLEAMANLQAQINTLLPPLP